MFFFSFCWLVFLKNLILPAERRRFLKNKKRKNRENLDQVLTQKRLFLDQVLTLQHIYIYIYILFFVYLSPYLSLSLSLSCSLMFLGSLIFCSLSLSLSLSLCLSVSLFGPLNSLIWCALARKCFFQEKHSELVRHFGESQRRCLTELTSESSALKTAWSLPLQPVAAMARSPPPTTRRTMRCSHWKAVHEQPSIVKWLKVGLPSVTQKWPQKSLSTPNWLTSDNLSTTS